MPDIGVPELLIIAVIVLLLFGPGKAAELGGSLGKSIREFRKATHEDAEPRATPPSSTPAASSTTQDADSSARFCTECGAHAGDEQKFCVSCGKPLAA